MEDEPKPHTASETSLWKGHSSQWTHFWYYFFCLLLAAGAVAAGLLSPLGPIAFAGLLIPVVMWMIRWWLTKCTTYELTSQRLIKDSGIFNRLHDELELYRVKDYSLERPFFQRILGLGTITLITSDVTHPTVVIKAVGGSQEIRETLRIAVQAERDRKRVREMDLGGSGGDSIIG